MIRSKASGAFGHSGTVSTVIRILLTLPAHHPAPMLDLPAHWKVKQ
ncbi:hypothetical protein BN2537_11913 [Streptomyces venezuelae]|nr:hypothetical protein BN2537_11913 [Streptomyces venezuelae]